MKSLIIRLISLYQKTLSPDRSWLKFHLGGGACRYLPTCSEYAKQSIEEHGIMRGVFLGVTRILRCHPWSSGGFDPILKRRGN